MSISKQIFLNRESDRVFVPEWDMSDEDREIYNEDFKASILNLSKKAVGTLTKARKVIESTIVKKSTLSGKESREGRESKESKESKECNTTELLIILSEKLGLNSATIKNFLNKK